MKKGFTLLELLVVIAIIGILSTVVLASLSTARDKATGAKAQQQMKQIAFLAQNHLLKYGSFGPGDSSCGNGSDNANLTYFWNQDNNVEAYNKLLTPLLEVSNSEYYINGNGRIEGDYEEFYSSGGTDAENMSLLCFANQDELVLWVSVNNDGINTTTNYCMSAKENFKIIEFEAVGIGNALVTTFDCPSA